MKMSCFELTIHDRVAHLVLNRPEKRNSMTPEFWTELPEAIRDIDDNSRARVIVISSTGPHFTSGIDIASLAQDLPSDPDVLRRQKISAGAKFYGEVKRMQETFTCLESCRLPVLVAVQGGCIGGGVDLITACDMRYATKDAFVTIFETNIAMTADVGTFPRISRLIPDGIARDLAYTGRRMPANEGKEVGLFNSVFDDQQEMLEFVMAKAKEIAGKAPLTIAGCKRMMNYARDHSTADTLDYIAIWNASNFQREEIAEAMAANAEKREPDFVELPPIKGHIE
jgi:enoyl-CoA hydratase